MADGERPFAQWPMKVDLGTFTGPDRRVGRTAPVRLSETVNVKDWGALGNGSANDYPSIQAAIDFCIWSGGGKVYFPAGQYKCITGDLVVGSNTDPDAFVQLIGGSGGGFGSNADLLGSSAGWLLSKGTKTYDLIQRVEGMGIEAGAGGGAIKITGKAVQIRNCYLAGMVLVDASQAKGATIMDCGGVGGDQAQNSGSTYPFSKTGVGFYLGDNCMASNCRWTGSFWISFALSGVGASVVGCSTETTYTGIRVGWAPDINPAIIGGGRELEAVSCYITGFQTERQTVSVDLYNARGCTLIGNSITGGHGSANVQRVDNMVWNSGTVTVTVNAGHNLPNGTSVLLLDVLDETPPPIPWRPNEFTTCTKTSPTQFTYAAPNPGGAYPGGFGWSWPALYGTRCRIVSESLIASNYFTTNNALASVDLQYNALPPPYIASPGSAIHSNNMMLNNLGDRGWLPPVGNNASGWKFLNCGVSFLRAGSNPSAFNNPNGQMLFANLPGQFTDTLNQYQAGPFEGQEFDIKDGSKFGFTPPTAAVWGDTVIGGGNGKYKVRWDGSVWKRVA
jgi:Pectate lyase superfamily protein